MLSLCLLSRFRPVLVHKFQHLPCYQLTQCVHPLSTKMKEQFLPITKQLPTAPKDCLLGLNPSPMWCVYRGYAKKLKTKSKKDKGKLSLSKLFILLHNTSKKKPSHNCELTLKDVLHLSSCVTIFYT